MAMQHSIIEWAKKQPKSKGYKTKSVLSGIINLYPGFKKAYGPYTRTDGRKHIVLYNGKGKTTTVSWPKAIMEVHLGERIVGDDTVDHKDMDFTNDNMDNLRIVTRAENARMGKLKVLYKKMACPVCGEKFRPTKSQAIKKRNNRPFCSSKCRWKGIKMKVGSFHHMIEKIYYY